MIRLEYQILLAAALDLVVGDPRWLPHPVRLMGRLATALERPARNLLVAPLLAGAVVAFIVIGLSAGAAWGAIEFSGRLHPLAGSIVGMVLLYTCFAAHDLAAHAGAVHRALARDDLAEARRRVGMMVSRDTDHLDEAGIARGTVESVAENMVDGVTAPLFFALLFGPVGAVAYKAISTLDSTFGYKTERYLLFGHVSARLDDLANYLPARLTAPLVSVAAMFMGLPAGRVMRIVARDHGRHSSPNAGYPEAAIAGALGVQLGGPGRYFGRIVDKPTIGDPSVILERSHIRRTTHLMFFTAALFVLAGIALKWCVALAWTKGGMP